MSTIGFILLTHTRPAQILRLVQRLQSMFPGAPIVCHHDFDKCPLEPDTFPGVDFVRPHLETSWGGMDTVTAIIASIRQLYARSDAPDWFVLLSGADYPVKPAHRILTDLARSEYDAHIDLNRILPSGVDDPWVRTNFNRYFAIRLRQLYWSSRLHRPSTRWRRVRSRHLPWVHRLMPWKNRPFSRSFHCFCGNTWFTANRQAAAEVLDFHAHTPRLAGNYAWKGNVDESYIHCILGNAPNLNVSQEPLHYMDWAAGGKSMKTLTRADLSAIQASGAHFARKFDPDVDSQVLDELDALIEGGHSETGTQC